MKKTVIVILLFNVITACSKEKFITYHFFSLGTIIDITIQEKYAEYLPEINKYINNLSDIVLLDEKNINTAYADEKINISKETIDIYKKSIFYYNISIKYDPSSYTVSSLYGFPEGPYHIPAEKDIINAKINAGFDKLILNNDYFIKKEDLVRDFKYLITLAKNDEKFVLVGAGRYGKRMLLLGEMLEKKYIEAVADNSEDRQGHIWNQYILVSVKDAVTVYRNSWFLIANKNSAFDILNELIHLGVSRDRILMFCDMLSLSELIALALE